MLLKTKHLKLCPRSLTSLHRLFEIVSIHVIGVSILVLMDVGGEQRVANFSRRFGL